MDGADVGYSPWVAKNRTQLSNFAFSSILFVILCVVYWSNFAYENEESLL